MQRSAAHTAFDFSYHVVFVPKRRRRIFGSRRSLVAESLFKKVAQKLLCEIDTLKVAPDHVHMLIMIPPKVSVSQVLQVIKSKVALGLLAEFPELRRELPDGTFWARGFYARTVGGLNEQLVRDYINRTDHF